MSVNGTQVEDKMRRFKGECAQFIFNRCPIYTHDGASAKFSTSSQEMDKSAESTVYPPSGTKNLATSRQLWPMTGKLPTYVKDYPTG